MRRDRNEAGLMEMQLLWVLAGFTAATKRVTVRESTSLSLVPPDKLKFRVRLRNLQRQLKVNGLQLWRRIKHMTAFTVCGFNGG